MILVWIFFVFVISLCNANIFLCHYYDVNSASLEIYCDHYRNRLPQNYTRDDPSLNPAIDPLQVVRLKIEGCDLVAIGEASERYPNIRSLDISYSGYRHLNWSGNAFEHVIDLDASFNELYTFPSSILDQFPKIQVLNLKNNYLQKIIGDDFEHAGHELRDLIVTNNMLTNIDALPTSLSRIELSNNQFSAWQPALSNSNVLEVVMLDNPQFTVIDCAVLTAIGSKHVYFTWAHITTFDAGENCSKWKFIADSGTMDGIFPNYLEHTKLFCKRLDGCFQNVRHFVAGRGAFDDVNKILPLLGPWVEKIDLSGNRIAPSSASTFQRFPNLRELSVSDTGLTAFDFNWLNIHSRMPLTHFDVSNNNIDEIGNPMVLQHTQKLAHFNAAGNRIQNANELIHYLPSSVQFLNLSGNNLSNVNAFNSFERLTALESLNVSDTDLSMFDANPFRPLRHLVSLDLSRANLSDVNFSTLKQMPQLKALRAANSQIGEIGNVTQHLGSSLEILDLSENSATTFDPNLFKRLSSLRELNLGNIHYSQDTGSEPVDLGQLPKSLERLDLRGANLQRIVNLDRTHFPVLNTLSVSENQLKCDYLNGLHSQFKDANVFGTECEQSHKFLIILFAILAILVISIVIILASLWILPKICK